MRIRAVESCSAHDASALTGPLRATWLLLAVLILSVGCSGSRPKVFPLLLITGGLQGNIEPCGCGSNHSGGLQDGMGSAVATRRKGQLWIDVGDTVGDGPLRPFVAKSVAEQWQLGGVDCVCLSPSELPELEQLRSALQVPFVCANCTVEGVSSHADFGGIRVSSVIGQESALNEHISDGVVALQAVFTGALADGLMPVVALHAKGRQRHAMLSFVRSVDQRFVVFDVGSTVASERGVARYGGGMVIRSAGRGRSFVDVAFNPEDPVYWAAITERDAKKGADNRVAELFRREVVAGVVDGDHLTSGYIGSTACAECHAREYDTWSKTRHASAMHSLERVEVDGRPDCYVCHVSSRATLPGTSGNGIPVRNARFDNVGCESCHGPGAQHKSVRAQLSVSPEATCGQCHVGKFSDGFEFAKKIGSATCQPSGK